MKYVYFEFNFFIFLKVLFSKNQFYFFLNKKNDSLKKIFIERKKNCKFIDFQTSKIFVKNQNIHFYVDKIVIKYSKELFRKFIKNKNVIQINKKIFNNEINLIFSRYIYNQLIEKVLKIETVNLFISGKKTFFFDLNDLEVKNYLEKKYKIKIKIRNKLNHVKLSSLKYIFKNLIFDLINLIFSNLALIKKKKIKSILFDVENKINLVGKFRSDFFFIKKKDKKNIIILNKKSINNFDKNKFYFINNNKFFFFKRNKKIQCELSRLFKIIYFDIEIKNKYKGFIYHIKNIHYLSKKIYPIFFYYNIKYYITTSSTNILSETVSLLRKFIKFETISYQYSFLREANPIMSTNVNHMFIFSNYFKKIFFNSFGRPVNVYSTGYIYSSLINKYKTNIEVYKKKFNLNNKFVIGYFDENCDDDNWSLTTISDMEKNYTILAKFVLQNPEFCILVKTQFLKNIPSILLFKNQYIDKAIKSGRFIEFNHFTSKQILSEKLYLKSLSNRNIVMPMMVALLSDITVSEKYGATTSLEAAIVGKRNIFINEKKYKSNLDKLFKKNIEFSNLEKALKRISIFKMNRYLRKSDNLGDWKNIIIRYLKIDKNSSFQIKINKILNNTNTDNNNNHR